MKKLFIAAAVACCGALAFSVPVSAQEVNTGSRSWFYFFSPRAFARTIELKGHIQVVIDGNSPIVFTHSNNTGRKPMRDAEIVYCLFGPQPPERQLGVSRPTFIAFKNREKAKPAILLGSGDKKPKPPQANLG